MNDPLKYQWSSYKVYLGESDKNGIVKSEYILRYFSRKTKISQKLYENYVLNKETEFLVDEIASTSEEELNDDIHLTGLFRMDIADIAEGLSAHWKKSIIQIMIDKKDIQRNMLVYLFCLIGRKTYKEISDFLQIKINDVGKSIKEIIDLMIKDSTILEQREKLLSVLQRKNFLNK